MHTAFVCLTVLSVLSEVALSRAPHASPPSVTPPSNAKTSITMTSEGGDAPARREKRWFPIESNPSVVNEYIGAMGFPTSEAQFVDMYGVEEWAVEMVPPGCLAAVFLYPLTEKAEAFREEEKGRIETDGQMVDKDLFYMFQTVSNAYVTNKHHSMCCGDCMVQ